MVMFTQKKKNVKAFIVTKTMNLLKEKYRLNVKTNAEDIINQRFSFYLAIWIKKKIQQISKKCLNQLI
jgi:DNA-binding HxlR family transcriptional regulator